MRSSINCPVPDIRDVKLHHRPNSHILWRGDAQQCINRILSCTRNEQQEASHNAEVFVKALHAGASEALVEEASSERTAAMTILWLTASGTSGKCNLSTPLSYGTRTRN